MKRLLMFFCIINSTEVLDLDFTEQERGVLERENGHIYQQHIQKAWDKSNDSSGILVVNYSKGKNIRLLLREYMQTVVNFPSWEVITNVYVGDSNSINYEVVGNNAVILTSKENIGIDTSLFVLGKFQSYIFYLRIEDINSSNISDLMVYIQSKKPTSNSVLVTDKPKEIEDLNFSYEIRGDIKICPKMIYNDNSRTYLIYNNNDLQTYKAYLLNGDDEILTNHEILDNKIIIYGVDNYIIRDGDNAICIKNLSI
jgi:type IV secretory pathway VirB9-like protein